MGARFACTNRMTRAAAALVALWLAACGVINEDASPDDDRGATGGASGGTRGDRGGASSDIGRTGGDNGGADGNRGGATSGTGSHAATSTGSVSAAAGNSGGPLDEFGGVAGARDGHTFDVGATGSIDDGGSAGVSVEPTGGASPTGGAGGTGGTPLTETGGWGGQHEGPTDAVDLLFVIDNSISMADKQELLSIAVPEIVGRLTSPDLDDEVATVTDLHVGVITSSLGGHGGDLCSTAVGDSFVAQQDDRGELIAPLRGLASYDDLGFLKFDPEGTSGEITDRLELIAQFTDLVNAAGDEGCGYEATLEAWYRFLVDPQPPVEVTSDGASSILGAVNTTLLEQRAAFMRPDSLLVIVMLSDENDCSIRDDGVSWLLTNQRERLPRSSEACLESPNDPCCRSCSLGETTPPDGCIALAEDAQCALGEYTPVEESLNLRCFDQKRRFGIDFLYPVWRYTDALTTPIAYGRACASDADCAAAVPAQPAGTCTDSGACAYPNAIFAANPNYPDVLPRRPDMVYLAAIVGVPWQDVATAESLTDPEQLEYLTGAALSDRWSVIVGDPAADVPPADPHMIESIEPRSGTNPITGDAIAPVTAAAGTNPINGHEYTNPERDDLQYACIYELETPRDCSSGTSGCSCSANATTAQDLPECQAPGTADFTTTQYYGKAYPGLRFLQVLRGIGDNALVGSVCPKNNDSTQTTSPSFGYNPIMRGITQLTDANLVDP